MIAILDDEVDYLQTRQDQIQESLTKLNQEEVELAEKTKSSLDEAQNLNAETEGLMRDMERTLMNTTDTLKLAEKLKGLEDRRIQNQKIIKYIEAFKNLREDKQKNYARWEEKMDLEKCLDMADTIKVMKQIVSE